MANFPPTWLDMYFGSVVAPTGSGFLRFTDGVADASAKLVSDADVASNAGIAGTKINTVFGRNAELAVRISDAGNVAFRGTKTCSDMAVGFDDIETTASDPTPYGRDTHVAAQTCRGWSGWGGHLYLDAGSSYCENEGDGGNVYLSAGQSQFAPGNIQVFGQIVGNSSYQDPLSFGVMIKDTGGNTTITLAGYEWNRLVVVLRGVLTANTDVIFPRIPGYSKVVKNETTGGSFSLTARTLAGGGGVVIPRGAGRWVYCDDAGILQLAA